MHELRESSDSRPVYYLDETWVNENHTQKYIWQDTTESGGLKVPLGKGRRLIICHVGSAKDGFLHECKWVFQSKTSSNDYHDEMNADSFKEWFIKLLYILEEGSIIVMDNAPYHSVLAEKIPNTSWTKENIQNWLSAKNIQYSTSETKPELLARVLPYKTQPKKYELDILANEMGHTVVRLPPYHCQYNPIELVWAKVKGEVASKNKTFKLKDVEQLVHDALNNVTKEDWKSRVLHAEALQEEDFKKECVRTVTIDKLIVNLAESSDTSSEAETEEEPDAEN
ncbi:uncharacterized protein LOC128999434 [Macrosteles quadrilineatus]|uniref:uncharacterized protein LOC128982197 n=1 Tax=Macrosteles quadrilineatus TaxID=74068 RepID=UPI0023E2273B|nr:uncharacterized protein LOC128982197 [Macrosteles quadrilineatus]XP_054281930.1 uncharacterized protein LOC128999434 [Macrosteles quadrilineatus]